MGSLDNRERKPRLVGWEAVENGWDEGGSLKIQQFLHVTEKQGTGRANTDS